MKKLLITIGITTIPFLMLFFLKTGIPSGEVVCNVYVSELPKETAFVELMIPVEDFGEDYIVCNKAMCEKKAIQYDSEIVKANYNGYASYSYHHKNASSENFLKECDRTYDENMNDIVRVVFGHNIDKKIINEVNDMVFAYVDKNGEILGLTESISLNILLEKNFININGKSVSVEYLKIKTSVLICVYFIFVLIESAVYFICKTRCRPKPLKKSD